VARFSWSVYYAKAQKSSHTWLWALSQVISGVNVICLLILNQRATNILRDKGLKVGILGASEQDLEYSLISQEH
jgi:hypothetical protein